MSEVNVCRVCLAVDVNKIYRIKSIRCQTFYEKLVNSKIEDGLPETFCYICYALLRKCTRFSNMAQQSQLMLTKLKNGGNMINKATVSKLNRPKHAYAVNNAVFISIESKIKPMDTLPEPDILIKEENLFEECLKKETIMNDIDESNNDTIDTISDRNNDNYDTFIKIGDINDDSNYTIDNISGRNDKINDDEEVNISTEQPCTIIQFIKAEDRTNKNNNRNDSNNDRNDNISDNKNDANDEISSRNDINNDCEDLNLYPKQACAVWTKEKVSVSAKKRKINKKEETNKDQSKSKIRCYQNKKKIKNPIINNIDSNSDVSPQLGVKDALKTYAKLSTSQSDNPNSVVAPQLGVEEPLKIYAELSTSQSDNPNLDVSQQHKVEKPLKTYAKGSKSQSNISNNDKSKLIPSPSDNDISKISKPLKTVSQTQQLLWRQLIASLDEKTQLSFRQKAKSSSIIAIESKDLTPYNFMKTKRSTEGYFQCSTCDYKCLRAGTFAQHVEACKIKYELMVKSDLNDPFRVGFACKICDFRTLSRAQFKLHKNEHIDEFYHCKICDYIAVSKQNFICHKNQHKNENTFIIKETEKRYFICDICQYRFKSKNSIIYHLKNHDSKRCINTCSECGFISLSRAAKREHTISVHNGLFSCKICDFKCTKQKELDLHTKDIHEHKPIQTCKFCDYKCALERHMTSHIWLRHEGAYKCSKCDFQGKKKKELKEHLLSEHNEEKTYACEECNYKTNERSSLKQHTIIHTGDGYICDICNYKSHSKSYLRVHMQIQHIITENNHLCQYCGKKFKSKSHLKQHLTIHGSKKISCSICEYKCYKKTVLKRHMMKHTGEKPFICDLCGLRLTRRANLRMHRNNQLCARMGRLRRLSVRCSKPSLSSCNKQARVRENCPP